jgi:hypothetical protein
MFTRSSNWGGGWQVHSFIEASLNKKKKKNPTLLLRGETGGVVCNNNFPARAEKNTFCAPPFLPKTGSHTRKKLEILQFAFFWREEKVLQTWHDCKKFRDRGCEHKNRRTL